MNQHTTELIGRFMADWTAGRRPDVNHMLAEVDPADRAPAARTLDLLIQAAPAPPRSRTTELAMDAWIRGEPVMRALRIDAGLSIRELARRVENELIPTHPLSIEFLTSILAALDSGSRSLDSVDDAPFSRALETALGARLADIPAWLLSGQGNLRTPGGTSSGPVRAPTQPLSEQHPESRPGHVTAETTGPTNNGHPGRRLH